MLGWLVVLALGAGPETPPGAGLDTPRCAEAAKHCYGLRVHRLGVTDATWDEAFLRAQLTHARQLFAPIDTSFEIVLVDHLDDQPVIRSRADRDALGHRRYTRGFIEVFVVDELDDVDEPIDITGETRQLRGVHWRDRASRDHRWVIVSRIAPEHVLAHELGHYFSLPHGTDPYSVMNKAPRADPPMAERGFVVAEQKKMRRAEARMRSSGYLVPRR